MITHPLSYMAPMLNPCPTQNVGFANFCQQKRSLITKPHEPCYLGTRDVLLLSLLDIDVGLGSVDASFIPQLLRQDLHNVSALRLMAFVQRLTGSRARWGGAKSLTCKYICRCAKHIASSWITGSSNWVMETSHQLVLYIVNDCKLYILSWPSIPV